MSNFLQLQILSNQIPNIAEHENFYANKYENANYCCHFHIISRENFMPKCIEHEKNITSGLDFLKKVNRQGTSKRKNKIK